MVTSGLHNPPILWGDPIPFRSPYFCFWFPIITHQKILSSILQTPSFTQMREQFKKYKNFNEQKKYRPLF